MASNVQGDSLSPIRFMDYNQGIRGLKAREYPDARVWQPARPILLIWLARGAFQ